MKTLLEILDLTNEPNIINDIIDKHIKMESKHTKLPWYVSHSKAQVSPLSKRIFKSIKTSKNIGGTIVANAFGGQKFSLESKTSESIAEAEANAELIVKCVNAHDELVKALQDIINDWSERMHNETEEFKPENDIRPGYWSPASSLVSSKIIANARAILKKITDTPI